MGFRSVLIFLLLLPACKLLNRGGKDLIILVDTSGSVRRANLVSPIQESIRQVVSESTLKGDRVRIYYFDKDVRRVTDQVIGSKEDQKRVVDSVAGMEAYGKWTHLAAALEEALRRTEEIHRGQPRRKVQIILYTDGRNDPPRGGKNAVTFQALMSRYFKDRTDQKDWFIYYVQMNEPDVELERLIRETNSGRIIKPEEFKAGKNFALPEVPRWVYARALPAFVFVMLVLFLQRSHPWFRAVLLVPSSDRSGAAINLGHIPKPWFRYFIVVGTGAESVHLGVDIRGRYYVRAPREVSVQIKGPARSGKQFLTIGQTFKFGRHEYTLQKSLVEKVSDN